MRVGLQGRLLRGHGERSAERPSDRQRGGCNHRPVDLGVHRGQVAAEAETESQETTGSKAWIQHISVTRTRLLYYRSTMTLEPVTQLSFHQTEHKPLHETLKSCIFREKRLNEAVLHTIDREVTCFGNVVEQPYDFCISAIYRYFILSP